MIIKKVVNHNGIDIQIEEIRDTDNRLRIAYFEYKDEGFNIYEVEKGVVEVIVAGSRNTFLRGVQDGHWEVEIPSDIEYSVKFSHSMYKAILKSIDELY